MLRSYHHLLLFLIRGSLVSDWIGLLSLIYSRVVYCTFMHSPALKKRGTLVCHYSNEQMLIREGCRGMLWGILNDVFGIGNVFWASRDHRRNPWIYAARRCHQNSESFVDLYHYYQFCTLALLELDLLHVHANWGPASQAAWSGEGIIRGRCHLLTTSTWQNRLQNEQLQQYQVRRSSKLD